MEGIFNEIYRGINIKKKNVVEKLGTGQNTMGVSGEKGVGEWME